VTAGYAGSAREAQIVDLLEQELFALRSLPPWPARDAAFAAVQAAIAALTAPRAGAHDRLADVEAALASTEEAASHARKMDAGSSGERIEHALVELARALRKAVRERQAEPVNRALGPAPARGASLRASVGTPSLHALERPPILPLVGLEQPGRGGTGAFVSPSSGAWGVEERSSRWRRQGAPAVTGDAAQVERLARDCMEDIANLSDLRQRGEDESWTALVRFEGRLLANLDALVALARGPSGARVFERLQLYSAESVVPDRGRAFALAFVLGCIEGEDAIRAAVMALRAASPQTHAGFRDAFCLASSPAVGGAMERLLHGDSAPLLRVALEVLRHRREARLPLLVPLVDHPDARVASRALRAAAACGERVAVLPLLEAKAADVDEEIAIAAAEGLLLHGVRTGLVALASRLRAEIAAPGMMARSLFVHALRLVALAGGPEELPLLRAAADIDADSIEALGWLGHPGAIEPLLDMLERHEAKGAADDEAARAARLAAQALHRLTGAGLRAVEGAPREQPVLVAQSAPWRAYWRDNRRGFEAIQRVRFGQPYTLEATLAELERGDTGASARRDAALELAIALGPEARIETEDWAARQRAALGAIRARISTMSPSPCHPGEWLSRAHVRRAATRNR
jgi:hypothetical protein